MRENFVLVAMGVSYPGYVVYRIYGIDYAGIGNAPSHMRTLLIMPAQQLLADCYNNCSISTMDVSSDSSSHSSASAIVVQPSNSSGRSSFVLCTVLSSNSTAAVAAVPHTSAETPSSIATVGTSLVSTDAMDEGATADVSGIAASSVEVASEEKLKEVKG